jgi:predicted dinucleotide-binding enzyme
VIPCPSKVGWEKRRTALGAWPTRRDVRAQAAGYDRSWSRNATGGRRVANMRIGILGSGSVGQTLGRGFARLGHSVRIGTRNAAKLTEWQRELGPSASVSSFSECAAWAEAIVLSVHGSAVEAVLGSAAVEDFTGKVVLDTCDPLDFSTGRPGLFVGTTDSLGERVQRCLPGARVVKTLNTVLAEVMINPALTGGTPDMFMAGNDPRAKHLVRSWLEAFGWSVLDLGDIQNARWLEALSLLWVVYAHQTGKTHHAFELVGK